jgi:phosphate starvation-inducible PhoH-like protein
MSGLAHALSTLRDVPGIGVVHLTVEDVVRHPLVARIIKAYASSEEKMARRIQRREDGNVN